MNLLEVGRALGGLLAVGEQRHPRSIEVEHRLCEGRAHVRELHQMLGPAAHVRADVEQQQRPDTGARKRQRKSGAIDAAVALEVEQAGSQR